MLRAIAFTLIFASCTAAAGAQSCANRQAWSNGGWLRCVVRLANGVCKVAQRVAPEMPPQARGACMAVGALNTLGNMPYHQYQVPPPRPLFQYTPPRLPRRVQPYLPNYPNYGPGPYYPHR
jgi:hypothetical protein